MHFQINSLFNLDPFTLFGVIVLICLIFGELISRTKLLPRISAYIFLGCVLGPNFLGVVSRPLLVDMQEIIDISLGLIAFSIGRHLDFSWLRNDKGLLYAGLTGFTLTTGIVSLFISFQGWTLMPAILAGIIAATTSPAVILMVARDLNSEGPVTRRSLTITSINNFLALVAISALLPFTELANDQGWMLLSHAVYRVMGSILLGLVCFMIMELLARIVIGKQRELQLLLLISVIILAISTGRYFNLSNMLVLLSFGVSARNFDFNRSLMEVNFSWLSHLFFIPLFFITGCYFSFEGLINEPLLVIAFILLRFIGQLSSNFIFARKSLLTYKQSFAISTALTPMTGIAIGITSRLLNYSPDIGQKLLLIVSSVLGILGLAGPILTQISFYKSDEV